MEQKLFTQTGVGITSRYNKLPSIGDTPRSTRSEPIHMTSKTSVDRMLKENVTDIQFPRLQSRSFAGSIKTNSSKTHNDFRSSLRKNNGVHGTKKRRKKVKNNIIEDRNQHAGMPPDNMEKHIEMDGENTKPTNRNIEKDINTDSFVEQTNLSTAAFLSLNFLPAFWSFRRTEINFMNIKKISHLKPNNYFSIMRDCIRFCHFKDLLYFPCYEDTHLNCYTLDGEMLNSINLDVYGISGPNSVHPLKDDRILIAADTGLFMLHITSGDRYNMCHRIRDEICKDVYVNDENAIALLVSEKKDGSRNKTLILQASNLKSPSTLLTIRTPYCKSILILGSLIYTTVNPAFYGNSAYNVSAYNIRSGEKIVEYGLRGRKALGELADPMLSACDVNGVMLVTDQKNNRIQLLTPSGKWSVLKGLGDDVGTPNDVVIVGDRLYLLSDMNTVKVYKIIYK